MKALAPTLEIQNKNSALPDPDQFLIETTKTKDEVIGFFFLLQADWPMKA